MPQDWIFGAAGGVMIGLAGAIFLLANGRILGASGLVGRLVEGRAGRTAVEHAVFLAGLVLVPAVVVLLFGLPADTNVTSNPLLLIAAGVLVGTGTRLANGCTSGHGVCGISRLSLRGIVATLFYIGAGAVTVSVFRHVLGVI